MAGIGLSLSYTQGKARAPYSSPRKEGTITIPVLKFLRHREIR